MVNEKQIRQAAIDLNDLLGCEPPLNPKGDMVILTEELKKAIKLLTPQDQLSSGTKQVVTELSGKKAKEEEPEEEVVEEEATTLEQDIENATRLKDLKDIATGNQEFKSIRGKLSSYKNVDDLREEMLALLEDKEDVPDAEEVPEDDTPEEEVPVKKPKAEKPVSDKPKKAFPKHDGPKTAFGHSESSGAGKIDNFLIKNKGKVLTSAAITEAVGADAGRIKSHIKHLIEKKGLSIDLQKADKGFTVKYIK